MAASVFSLSACAVRSEPVLTSSSGPAGQFQEITLVIEEGASEPRNLLHSALASELSSRNIGFSDRAPYVGDYSISTSGAEVPLYTSQAGKTEDAPAAVVVVRERKWSDSCEAVRTRATLAVFRVSDGLLLNRSIAEAIICDGDTPPFEGLAKALVDGVAGA
jgi:hypothetical protein